MGRKVQLRGGTALEHTSFIGDVREITVDTTNKTVRVHDGVTYGGIALAKESVTTDHATRITRIEADGTVDGSITYKINAAINALKDGVNIDVDTLKEISDAINDTSSTAAVNLANSIVSLRNELKNGATTNADSFKEVEDLLTAVNNEIANRYTKAEVDFALNNIDCGRIV